MDFYTAAKRNPRWSKAVKPLDGPTLRDMESDGKGKGTITDVGESSKFLPTEADGSTRRPNKAMQQANKEHVMQDDNKLLLMYPLLHAFSLVSRKWSMAARVKSDIYVLLLLTIAKQ